MMKKFKKIAGLMLALVIALAMGVTALAETYTITIDNQTEGYVYTAYQIFKGTLSEDGTVLSNVEWGDDVDADALIAALKTASEDTTGALSGKFPTQDDNQQTITYTAQMIADIVATFSNNSNAAKAFAEIVKSNLKSTATGVASSGNYGTGSELQNYQISGLDAGYYLIVNTTVPSGTETSSSSYILEVVDNVTVSPKTTEIPTFDKEVGVGTTTTDPDKETTANYAVGDSVPFTLTATLPDNYSAYSTYTLVFHDTMSDGLDFDADSVVVTVDSQTLSTGDYSMQSTINSDSTTTITITINDLKAIETKYSLTLSAGDTVVVTYNATLNSKATHVEEEENNAYLEYSNNPDGSSTGNTKEDKTYVVTFELDVKKTNGSGNPLEGAEFTLYKYNTVSEEYEAAGTVLTKGYQALEVPLTAFTEGVTYYTLNGTNYEKVDDTSGNPDSSITYYVYNEFTLDGLAVGKYKLVETKTPDGYNTIDDIEFEVTATTSEDESTNTVTTNYTITGGSFTESNGVISTTIENNSGSELPSTGGIGTTIFYIVGTLLILLAAVLLITRSRMRRSEEE